jgi:hypothetical protein
MNKEDKGILIGMCIGDGYLQPSKYTTVLKILHSQKQEEYIKYKAQLLSNILNKEVKVKNINNNGYPGVEFRKGHKYFRIIRKWLYNNNKKKITRFLLNKLTPKSIAIWYMDDGSLYPKKRNGKIHAYELILSTYISKEDNQIIIDYFKEIWDLEFHIVKSKGLYRLRMNTKNIKKFIPIIQPYIIPSLEYKIKI